MENNHAQDVIEFEILTEQGLAALAVHPDDGCPAPQGAWSAGLIATEGSTQHFACGMQVRVSPDGSVREIRPPRR